MNATEFSQIVISPDDATDELLELLELLDDAPTPTPFWPRVKVALGWALHPFGVHTWVRWRHYDPVIDRVVEMPGVVCQFCGHAHMT